MPGTHFTAAQVQHAERQLSAGVRWRQVRSNQRTVFGSRASVPSRASLFRWRRRGPRSAQALRCRRVFPGRTLTRRQKRLLREAMERSSQTRTSELSAMLGREEIGISQRDHFAHSTIDDFLRDEENHTVKVLTVYDPRRNFYESARSRSSLKRYPVRSLVVIDASHLNTDKDSARKRGRSRRGTRAVARQFRAGGRKLTVMGVMTVEGMQVDACGFLVRPSEPSNPRTVQPGFVGLGPRIGVILLVHRRAESPRRSISAGSRRR